MWEVTTFSLDVIPAKAGIHFDVAVAVLCSCWAVTSEDQNGSQLDQPFGC
jgi:hypothetical protein